MNRYCYIYFLFGGLLFLLPDFLFGQTLYGLSSSSKDAVRWNIVSDEDLQMETYKLDPDAVAVILADQGVWVPENWEKGSVRFFRHIRIKILKEAGLKYAKREIRYRKDEKLSGFRAQTMSWNSFSQEKESSKISKKELIPDTLIGEEMLRRFEFPNVEVGSIIEYKYSLVTESMEELKPWYFQSEIPTKWSEVQTRGFEGYIYKTVPMGTEIKAIGQGVWRAKYIAALPQESLAGNLSQYRSGIRFYLTAALLKGDLKRRWTNLREQLQYNTFLDPEEKQMQALYLLSLDLTEDALTEEEKAARIYQHLQGHVRWNDRYDLWVQKDPANVYKNRTGNGTELNMLLFYLLDMAGLKPQQIFVSTKDHGPASKFPLFNQYNHVICQVKAGETNLYMDLTEKLAPYDLPSIQVINGHSLLLKDSTTHLINLLPTRKTTSLWMMEGDLTETSLTLEVKESHSGYAALERRKAIANKESGVRVQGDTFRPMKQVLPTSPRYENIEEAQFPFDVYYTLRPDFAKYAERKGDTLFISALACFSTYLPFEENSRSLPIDLEFLRSYNFMINFPLPEGYELVNMPKAINMSVANKSIGYILQTNLLGNIVSIQSKLDVRKPIIYPEDYPALLEFYKKMLESEQARLVLVKK